MLVDDPDVKPFIGAARDRLIKEAIGLARDADEVDIAVYAGTHPERRWMVQAASKAKAQVEDEPDEQILHYCKMHIRHMTFVRAALSTFAPNRDTTFTLSPTSEGMKDQPRSAPIVTVARPSASLHTSMVAAETTKVASPVKIALLDPVPSADHGVAQSPSENITKSNGDNGVGGDPGMSSSVNTAGPAPQPPDANMAATGGSVGATIGILVATIFDAAGQFLCHRQVGVAAPVQAAISVISRDPQYDPKQLIGSIEALAQSMTNCSSGLHGVGRSENGLWNDNE